MTTASLLAQVRALPGVLGADLDGNRLAVKMAARDWFPVRRRVAAWTVLCGVPLELRYEFVDVGVCGVYDSMERAISSLSYRPSNAIGFPAR